MIGRREANKRATRSALQDAATRLFAEHGFAGTTVRDIADAAGVTERTFFRYFAGKEELILDDILEWLPGLQSAIRDRPADEAPLQAVGEAVKGLLRLAGARAADGPLALFANGRPVNRLGTSGAAFVLRVESDVADAVAERLSRARADETGQDRFLAEVVARVSVAVFRSAMIRDVELRNAGCAERPALDELYDSALASVTDVAVA